MAKKKRQFEEDLKEYGRFLGKKKMEVTVIADYHIHFLSYACFIEEHISRGSRIPARVLKRFMSFFEVDDEQSKLGKETNKLVKQCLLTLSKDYIFKGFRYEDIGNPFDDNSTKKNKIKIKYSIETLLHHVFRRLIVFSINKKKDEVLKKTYKLINDYVLSNLNKKHKEFLTPYRKSVITAKVAIIMGYKLTEDKTPSNEKLFQSVRNALKSLQ